MSNLDQAIRGEQTESCRARGTRLSSLVVVCILLCFASELLMRSDLLCSGVGLYRQASISKCSWQSGRAQLDNTSDTEFGLQ
jgi:hypothetical protein